MAVDLESTVMAENLLSKNQKGTTPAFREGWDRTFNLFLKAINRGMNEHDKEMQKYTERRIFTGK